MLIQSFVERLRPLVGIKSWDYIVLWKLSNDHRCIELMDCCCGGSENMKNGGEEVNNIFEESCFVPSCRDCIFPHPRIKTCDLLQHLPSSIPLTDHSGVHAQTLLSNHPVWLNYSSDPSLSQEAIGGTRVLIPLSLGLLELFVTKQDVAEDEQLIDFIMSQCNFYLEEQAHIVTMSNNNSDSFSSDHPNNNNNNNSSSSSLFHQHQISNTDHQHLPQDISIDRIHLCNNTNSPLNPLQQFINTTETNINNSIFDDQSTLFTPLIDNNGLENRCGGINEANEEDHNHKNECENNRSDESDPNDDEYDAKYRRRTGKGPQSKNLRAERRRRKKLNDRLYALRALVPNISKLDRASILGDAIDYVNELKKQADDLQMELEDKSDNEDHGRKKMGKDDSDQMSLVQENGSISGKNKVYKHNHEPQDNTNDKVQQMEPQVQVFQIEGNEFFVKVFCEHKSGGFVRLMEALNSLGLEVTNVNTTRHTCLVSTIFQVEQKNNDAVQADHVKESLLELTRNPSRMWPNNAAADQQGGICNTNNNNNDNINNNYRGHQHDHSHHHSLLHSRHINAHHLQH